MRAIGRDMLILAAAAASLATGCAAFGPDVPPEIDPARALAVPFYRAAPRYPREWDKSGVARPAELPEVLESRKALNSRLAAPIQFDFIATPFEDVMAFLAACHKFSQKTAPRVVVPGESRDLTMKVDPMPFNMAFDAVCRAFGLAWTWADGALYVTTRPKLIARYTAPTVFYDKADWKRFEDVMNAPVSVDFHGVALADAVQSLREQAKVNIIIDPRALEGKDKKVYLKVERMDLRRALAWLCHELELAYTVRHSAVFISTPEALRPKPVIAVHDVSDLLVGRKRGAGPRDAEMPAPSVIEQREKALAALIAANIEPWSWAAEAGENAARIDCWHERLVIRQHPAAQEQALALLKALRSNGGRVAGVRSLNTAAPDASLRLNWKRTASGTAICIVPDSIVQALIKHGRDAKKTFPWDENVTEADAVVGACTFIANLEELRVAASDARGTTIEYDGRRAAVPHGRHLLIHNGGFVTVVTIAPARLWTGGAAAEGKAVE